jgi:hypothetical protein
LARSLWRGRAGSYNFCTSDECLRATRQDRGGDGRSLSSSGPSSLPLRWLSPFPHSSLRWGSPPPPLQPRQFSSGFASRQSAATFGAVKLRRVLPLLPRRYHRVAGPAPVHWQQRALGSPPSPDLLPSQLSPARGSLARQRELRMELACPSNMAK